MSTADNQSSARRVTRHDVEEFHQKQALRLAQEWKDLTGEDMFPTSDDHPHGQDEVDMIEASLSEIFCFVNVPKMEDAFEDEDEDDDNDLDLDEEDEEDDDWEPVDDEEDELDLDEDEG